MPWLGRRSSQEMMDPDMCPSMRTQSASGVTFLPAMMDVSCGTMPISRRQSGMTMILTDMRIMVQNIIDCYPDMIRSLWAMDLGRSVMGSIKIMDMVDLGLQMILGMMQIFMMMAMVPACMMLPGVMLLPACMTYVGVCMMLCWPLNGETVMRCSCCKQRAPDDIMAEERWIHINGSMTRYERST